jgi:cation:H+ antiporter
MATTLAGVVRGHTAISAGNVIGSDIFNVLGVLGLAGMLHPMPLDPAARASLLALTGMVLVVFLMMRSGWRVSRVEGVTLVALAAVRWALDVASRT